MKYVFTVLLSLLLAGVAMAGDSGVYYDPDRSGEGLSLHRSGDVIVGFLFTYGGEEEEVFITAPPYPSPQKELYNPLNGQRWFLISGDTLIDNEYSVGYLYGGGGMNYPVRLVPNPIGAVEPVGEYLLERSGAGWSLSVDHIEESDLNPYDPLFSVPFDFDVLVIGSED